MVELSLSKRQATMLNQSIESLNGMDVKATFLAVHAQLISCACAAAQESSGYVLCRLWICDEKMHGTSSMVAKGRSFFISPLSMTMVAFGWSEFTNSQ